MDLGFDSFQKMTQDKNKKKNMINVDSSAIIETQRENLRELLETSTIISSKYPKDTEDDKGGYFIEWVDGFQHFSLVCFSRRLDLPLYCEAVCRYRDWYHVG